MNFIYSAIAGALIAALGIWKFQEYRYEGQISEIKLEMALKSHELFEQAQAEHDRQIKQKDEALNEAKKRESTIRKSAAAASNAVSGLREQLASAKRELSESTAEATRRYAETLSDVLGSCTAEYQQLAEEADRIQSDKQTLIDSWPQ